MITPKDNNPMDGSGKAIIGQNTEIISCSDRNYLDFSL